MQEVEGSIPTGGTCLNDFSDPIDQDIRTQCALSWKIVVSEWRSVIAGSLNVGGGVRLKSGKTVHVHPKHYKHSEDGRTAPGVCGNGPVPLSHSGNVVTRIGIHTHTQVQLFSCLVSQGMKLSMPPNEYENASKCLWSQY